MARVDDRLIHGQVIHGWMPRLNARLLVVADPHLAIDPQEQLISRLAVPEDVEVRFIEPEKLPEVLDEVPERDILVLFRTPMEAWAAISRGFHPDSLNLGNLHFEQGKIQLRKTFCCNEAELAALRKIAKEGVTLEYQPAPDLRRIELDLDREGV